MYSTLGRQSVNTRFYDRVTLASQKSTFQIICNIEPHLRRLYQKINKWGWYPKLVKFFVGCSYKKGLNQWETNLWIFDQLKKNLGTAQIHLIFNDQDHSKSRARLTLVNIVCKYMLIYLIGTGRRLGLKS